jgi:hypothetical protein
MAKNFGIITPSEWKGLTLEDAKKKATNEGFATRISEIDGRSLMLTMDFKSDRINFRVRDNKIVEAYTG